MAFPTNVLGLAHAIGSQFLSVFFGGSVAHSTGINQIIDDLIAVEEKLGTGASTPTANTVLRGTGAGVTAFGQIVAANITNDIIADAHVNSAAAIAVSKLAPMANKSLLTSNGTTNSASTSPTVSGTFIAETDLQASARVRAGARLYPGTINGPSTGVQASMSFQMPYLNHTSGGLAANTSTVVTGFPLGMFWCLDSSTGSIGAFFSNGVATLADKGSDTPYQIGGSVPADSSSKIYLALSGSTLSIRNCYSSAQLLAIIGLGAG